METIKLIQEIAGSNNWTFIEEIKRGWSSDRKFFIETQDNEKLLLRISHINTYEAKYKEFRVIKKYAALGFPMSQPISFGICNDHQNVYMLLTWVEGEDLEKALPQCSYQTQYQLGREAGLILRKIHSLPVADEDKPTTTNRQKKERQLDLYMRSSVRVPNDEALIEFIQENIYKVSIKSPVYQHGDFHPGNLILTREGKIGVIDFNRWEINDPYEEFYKLELFSTDISMPYCVGQIDAYFADKIPDEFWEILAIYIAHSSLYSIEWAKKFGQPDIDHMTNIYHKVMDHYEGFSKFVPKWYEETKKEELMLSVSSKKSNDFQKCD